MVGLTHDGWHQQLCAPQPPRLGHAAPLQRAPTLHNTHRRSLGPRVVLRELCRTQPARPVPHQRRPGFDTCALLRVLSTRPTRMDTFLSSTTGGKSPADGPGVWALAPGCGGCGTALAACCVASPQRSEHGGQRGVSSAHEAVQAAPVRRHALGAASE